MSVTVNLRNDTSLFIKVNGIDEVIVPNSEVEDKTIQWISIENKTIQIFDNEACNGAPVCQGSLNFVTNDGIFVDRGDFSGAQLVKMQADVLGKTEVILQIENGGGGKLLEWAEITSDTVLNLTFWNI
jgi:hypothetical protein